jgi:hypothetical protein
MSDSVSSFFSSVGLGGSLSNDIAPIVGLGAAAFTGGASLGLDAVAAADATAAGLGYSSAAEAIDAGAATATELGLPAGTTLSDLAAAGGTASQAFVDPSAFSSFVGPSGIPDVQAANAAAAAQGASGLQGLLGTAKSAGQLIGGIGQIGQAAQLLSGAGKVSPQQADPFAQYRSGLAAQLNQLLQNPNTVTTTPGYQFNLSQGLQGLQAQQAAQGRLVSGGALLQGQQYGQQLASQTYQQQLQNLASLSGATQSPATGATTQQQLGLGNVGSTALGLQQLGAGAAGVLNPLATLYSQYNTPSPSVS